MTGIYKVMPPEKLRQEGDALMDQLFAYMTATGCSSIETLYDMDDVLQVKIYGLSKLTRRLMN